MNNLNNLKLRFPDNYKSWMTIEQVNRCKKFMQACKDRPDYAPLSADLADCIVKKACAVIYGAKYGEMIYTGYMRVIQSDFRVVPAANNDWDMGVDVSVDATIWVGDDVICDGFIRICSTIRNLYDFDYFNIDRAATDDKVKAEVMEKASNVYFKVYMEK